jgi:two-component system LytT family response regulator
MSQKVLSLTNGSFNCAIQQIVRIEASSNYSKIYLLGLSKPYIACKVLNWLQQELPASEFVRVHRSHLVNKKYICMQQHLPNNLIHLTTGDTIEVSRRRRNVLHAAIEE